MSAQKKKPYKKIALALSLCVFLLWAALGAGASLAWFADTSPELTNIFHFADFEVAVSHRLEDGTWQPVDSQTKLFDENAVYEPGYTQVVFLKIENLGETPFDFKTAVSVFDFSVATNYFGQHFYLQDYLRFGIAVADTEAAMDAKVKDRLLAAELATMKLSNYATESAGLAADGEVYMALVICMPETVDNEANYQGATVPFVELGIIVSAIQQR